VITRHELDANHFATVYDAVVGLRQSWLQARGPDSFTTNAATQVVVYMDNNKVGGVETLRGIATNAVTWVRHYDGNEATARWGLGHGAGVIYVSTHPEMTNP
jgi:hypothetical protein